MARNGAGTYSLSQPAFVAGTVIDQAAVNSDLSDIASALTASIANDGQTPILANLPMGGFKLTGVALATATGDALSYGRAATVTDLLATGNTGLGTAPTAGFKLDVDGPIIGVGPRSASSGNGGNIRYRIDTGTAAWFTGVLGTAAAVNFSIYDLIGAGAVMTFLPTSANGLAGIGVVPTASQGALQLLGSAAGGLKLGNVNNTYANALDWYEEGTFTPQLLFGGASVGMTGTFTGRFTRIGNTVFARVQITLTAKGSSTGTATISGMPYASSNNAGSSVSKYIAAFNMVSGGAGTAYMVTQAANTSAWTVGFASTDGTASGMTAATDTKFANTSVLTFDFTYDA